MVDNVFDANNYIHDFSEISDYDWETPLWDEEQMKVPLKRESDVAYRSSSRACGMMQARSQKMQLTY